MRFGKDLELRLNGWHKKERRVIATTIRNEPYYEAGPYFWKRITAYEAARHIVRLISRRMS